MDDAAFALIALWLYRLIRRNWYRPWVRDIVTGSFTWVATLITTFVGWCTFQAIIAPRLAAGEAYSALDYVACDELGRPLDPARLRRVWYRLMREAGIRQIKPYDASRHAAGSYLSRQGVSPAIIAAWLGHSDPSFTMKVYVHARPEDLAAARDALARKITKE